MEEDISYFKSVYYLAKQAERSWRYKKILDEEEEVPSSFMMGSKYCGPSVRTLQQEASLLGDRMRSLRAKLEEEKYDGFTNTLSSGSEHFTSKRGVGL